MGGGLNYHIAGMFRRVKVSFFLFKKREKEQKFITQKVIIRVVTCSTT